MKRIAVLLVVLIATPSFGQQKRTPLKHEGWSSLSGVVSDPSAFKPALLEGAVVFLKIAPTEYFPIHPDDRKSKGPLTLEVGGAQFDPRVFTLFTFYFDGEKQRSTGQMLRIVNSGAKAENVRMNGSIRDAGFNVLLPAGKDFEHEVKPNAVPTMIASDINTGKVAWVSVFDHPYHAVTGTDGKFTLPRVPANCEVRVVVWHREHGWLNDGPQGKTMKLAKTPNFLNLN
jgi:hypothetical protein